MKMSFFRCILNNKIDISIFNTHITRMFFQYRAVRIHTRIQEWDLKQRGGLHESGEWTVTSSVFKCDSSG